MFSDTHIADLRARVARLERLCDHLLNHLNIRFEETEAVDPHVLNLVREGRKVEAIQALRAKSDISLPEAKAVIDKLSKS